MKLLYTFKIVPQQQGKNKHNNEGLKFDITMYDFSKNNITRCFT